MKLTNKTKKLVDNLIKHFQEKLHLTVYNITVEYKKLDCAAQVTSRPKYHRALIEIDFENIPDEIELTITIKHELLHLLHGGFDDLINEIIGHIAEEQVQAVYWNVSRILSEQLVTHVERLLVDAEGR